MNATVPEQVCAPNGAPDQQPKRRDSGFATGAR